MDFWNNALKVGGIVVVGIFAYVTLGTNIIAHLYSWNSEQIELAKWVLGGLFLILFFVMFNHDSSSSNNDDYVVPREQEIDLDLLFSNIHQKNDLKTEDTNIVKIDRLMYANQHFVLKYTWKEAKEMVENFELEGYSDWRLPTIDELVKLGTNKAISKKVGYSFKDFYIREEFIESMPTPEYSYSNSLYFWSSETFRRDNSSWLNVDIQFYAYIINYAKEISKYSKQYSYFNIDSKCYVIYVRDIY